MGPGAAGDGLGSSLPAGLSGRLGVVMTRKRTATPNNPINTGMSQGSDNHATGVATFQPEFHYYWAQGRPTTYHQAARNATTEDHREDHRYGSSVRGGSASQLDAARGTCVGPTEQLLAPARKPHAPLLSLLLGMT